MSLVNILRQIGGHPLNRKRPLAALSRFLRWQISSRLAPGSIATPFVNDTFLLAKPNMVAATGNYYYGLMEVNDMGFALHMLRPTDLFADIGANIGSYTIIGAAAIGARVVAVEPIAETFESLRRNVLANGVHDRVELHNIGLADRPGTLRFAIGGDAVNHVLRDNEVADNVELSVATLDEVMVGRTPALIKIDVEGFELKVLEGASETLARSELLAVIVETLDLNNYYGATNDSIVRLLAARGFRRFCYDPFARKLLPYDATDLNSIFVRSYNEVMERVTTAPRYRLVNGDI